MELETIGSITMGCLTLKSLWQIDNGNGVEWALFDAHTASNAHRFGDEANFACLGDINTYFSLFIQWAGLAALLSALLRLTLIWVDNGDSNLTVSSTFHRFFYINR